MLVLHVLHLVTEMTYKLEELYHNRLLHQLYGVSPEFRFAWGILNSITIQLLDTDKPEPIAVRIREDAKGQKSAASRVIYVTGSDQISSSTSARSVSNKRPRSVDDAAPPRRDTATYDDLDSDDSDSDDSDRKTRWDSRVSKRRGVDSDSEGSVDSEFEDFSRPVKRGRTSARPISLTGSLATLPCSTRSNSSAATKIDAAIDPKVSGVNSETGEIVPVKRLD
ncbi:hypothetical protein F5Y06DRAFT_273712 [Hypoxylon sp. FL0890]|nr:hypothetical protein F5Y06DRAFT_273712 [Hypoxylon sp. FL0890]